MTEVELRRNQDTLVIIGSGVIVFGIWSIIRTFLTQLFGADPILEIDADSGSFERVIGYIGAGIVLAVELGIRLYIGLSARAEGMGKPRGRGYLMLSWLLLIGDLLLILLGILSYVEKALGEGINAQDVISVLIEITNAVILAQLITASRRVKRIVKHLAGENAGG